MKKRLRACLLMILAVLSVSGCSSTSVSKEKDYAKVIESALQANQELVKEYNWEKEDLFERKQSDIMIWEDDNNYYVYLRKNIEEKLDGKNNSYVRGDGYKIGKNNDKWDSSPDDRTKIKAFLDDNVSPVYEENNVELVSDDENMR